MKKEKEKSGEKKKKIKYWSFREFNFIHNIENPIKLRNSKIIFVLDWFNI